MFLSIFIESILWQVIIFAVVSIILLVIATKYLVDRDKDVKYNTNLPNLIIIPTVDCWITLTHLILIMTTIIINIIITGI